MGQKLSYCTGAIIYYLKRREGIAASYRSIPNMQGFAACTKVCIKPHKLFTRMKVKGIHDLQEKKESVNFHFEITLFPMSNFHSISESSYLRIIS